ncbi:hypothetical protein OAO01_03720 [Oligoflexia bacterium]|nr:hypothetical protein [Oligoflexia bacterium]
MMIGSTKHKDSMLGGLPTRWNRCSRGALLVEVALVLVPVMLMILCSIELVLYFGAKSALSAGLHKGASVASVLPGLEDDSVNELGVSANADEVEALKQIVVDATKKVLPGSVLAVTTGDVQVFLPAVAGQPLEQTLNTEPIEIQVQAYYQSPTGVLPALPINLKAISYRELLPTPPFPLSSDCNGAPLDPTALLGADTCCAAGLIFKNGECGCTGQLTITADDTCVCLADANDCAPNQIWIEDECHCEQCWFSGHERDPDAPWSCVCINRFTGPADCGAQGKEWNSWTCACYACNEERVFDADAVECVCANAETVNDEACAAENKPYISYYCTCGEACADGTNFNLEIGECDCSILEACPGDLEYSYDCSECECPSKQVQVEGTNNCIMLE